MKYFNLEIVAKSVSKQGKKCLFRRQQDNRVKAFMISHISSFITISDFFSQSSIYVSMSRGLHKNLVKSQLWKSINLAFLKSFWLHCGRLNGDATLFMLEKANVVLIMISDTFHLGWQTWNPCLRDDVFCDKGQAEPFLLGRQ